MGKDCGNQNIWKNPRADKYLQKPRYAAAWWSKDYISTAVIQDLTLLLIKDFEFHQKFHIDVILHMIFKFCRCHILLLDVTKDHISAGPYCAFNQEFQSSIKNQKHESVGSQRLW